MNKHDRDNLNFLLYASSEVIADWMAKVDEDDIAYAHELLAMAAEEMNEQARALVVEAELAQMDRYALAEKVISLVK
jgi:hypothetical protein